MSSLEEIFKNVWLKFKETQLTEVQPHHLVERTLEQAKLVLVKTVEQLT